jgi:hypothetical protein
MPATPLSIPKFVLDRFTSQPFTWTWTTKSGPNMGKSFHVPYIPTNCKKTDSWVVRWMVDLFHSFKAHLSPHMLDSKGWVPIPLVRLYQSNMLLHYRRQLVLINPPPPPAIKQPPNPTPGLRPGADSAALCPQKPPKTPTEVERLRAEVTRLQERVAYLTQKQPPPSPSSISPLRPPPRAPCTPFPPPQCLVFSAIPTAHPGFPAYPSLHSLFSHSCCPAFIRELHPESTPLTSTFTPEDATHVVQVHWPPGAFEYFSLDSNGNVYISPNTDTKPDTIVTMPEEDEEEDDIEFQLSP